MWACNLTDSQAYQGRSNLFVPEFHHQIENTVNKALAGMFPNPDYLGVVPLKSTVRERAEKIRAAVYHQLEYKNNIQCLFDVHERQKSIMGTSPMRCSFVNQSTKIFVKNKNGIESAEIPKFKGVKWQIVDIFRWYIVPEWATMDDYFMIFEDDFTPKHILEGAKLYDKPMFVNLDDVREVSDLGTDLEHNWVDTQRMISENLSNALSYRKGQIYTTKVYIDFDIEEGVHVPCEAVIANNGTLIRLVRNQFWMQKAPYVVGRYVRQPVRNFYGFSMGDKLRSLSYQMNDIANQTMDSLNYSLNPIVVIDPALAGDPKSFIIQPGAKWWGSPQGIQMQQFPDVSGSGFQAMQQVRAMVSQFSDSSPSVAPQLQGKARSATQASVIDREVNQDMRISSKVEEIEVLEPMCHMTHSLLQQFQKDTDQIRIQGPENGQWIMDNVSPEDLEGEVDFVWQGAQVAEKTAVYTQQLMSFFQMAVQMSTSIPELKGKVDLPKLFERVAKDGFKLDRIEDFMVDIRDNQTVDQDVENIAIAQLQDVPTHSGDDDQEHLTKIDAYLEKNKKLTLDQKLAFLKHGEKHKVQQAGKDAEKQNQARLAALQMAMQQQGPQQGQGGPPQQGQPQAGRPFQIGQGTSQSALATGVRGVQPG